MSLTPQIFAALNSFCTEMTADPRPFARERELVSWFVMGHLAKQLQSESVLNNILQIGIELACPQEARVDNPRSFPDVCKDIVIWPHPRDTCWTEHGHPERFPLSVIEWKALNRRDTLADLKRKRSEANARDAEWLKWFSRQAGGREGFSIVSDLTQSQFALSAWRCVSGSELEPILVFGGGAAMEAGSVGAKSSSAAQETRTLLGGRGSVLIP